MYYTLFQQFFIFLFYFLKARIEIYSIDGFGKKTSKYQFYQFQHRINVCLPCLSFFFSICNKDSECFHSFNVLFDKKNVEIMNLMKTFIIK